MTSVDDFWVYLRAGPLLWLVLTLGAYSAAFALFRLGRGNPLLNPVAIAVALIVAVLVATGTDYQTYFGGAQCLPKDSRQVLSFSMPVTASVGGSVVVK